MRRGAQGSADTAREVQRTDNRAQVADSAFKTEVRNVSVGRSHPAVVVANHAPPEICQSVCYFLDVAKPGAIAIGFAEDVGRKHEGQPFTDADIGNAHAIAGGDVVHR